MVKVLIGLAVVLVVFLGYVATRPASFRYSNSALIKASPEKIYPYLSQLQLGGQWSPYEKRAPDMKKSLSGTDGTPGAKLEFDGGMKAGVGSVELLSFKPNEEVNLRLLMSKPVNADHLIVYKLEPVGAETRFTWSMEGENGFFGKLMGVLIDCEAMMKKDMNEGFENLRKIVEL